MSEIYVEGGTEEMTFTRTDLSRAIARAANESRWCSEVYNYCDRVSEELGHEIGVIRARKMYPHRVTVEIIVPIPVGSHEWIATADKYEMPEEANSYDVGRYTVEDHIAAILNDHGAYGISENMRVTAWERTETSPYFAAEDRDEI